MKSERRDVSHKDLAAALESYLRALNAMPGIATSVALLDFLGSVLLIARPRLIVPAAIADVMTPHDWYNLYMETVSLSYYADTIVLAEGEANDFLFYVVAGTVRQRDRGPQQLLTVALRSLPSSAPIIACACCSEASFLAN